MQTIDFLASGGSIRQQRQDDVEGIEDDAFGTHFIGLRFERGEHAAQVEGAGLHQIGGGLRIHEQPMP